MIHLVVTCVGSKISGPGYSISDAIDKIGSGPLDVGDLYTEWKALISSQLQCNRGVKSAKEMYKGATWSAALNAYSEIEGAKRLWIISCGFGLISEDEQICKYAATFKQGESDSVYKRGRFASGTAEKSKSEWWLALIESPPLGKSRIHSLHQLVDSCERDDIIVIAAGADYLSPISTDLNLIKEPKSSFYIIGYKLTEVGMVPDPPAHLSNYIAPYRDGKKYRRFLKEQLGTCSATQVQNKAAQYLIQQIQEQKPVNVVFP